jgi:riboflavin transport system permease protein
MTKQRISESTISPVLSIGAALLITVVIILLASKSPLETLSSFFLTPFSSSYQLGNLLQRSTGLILTGLGMCIAFQGGMFNLGGEGQVYFSAVAAAFFFRNISGLPGIAGMISGCLFAIFVGAVLAGISGFLRHKWNADELITSFLLSGSIIPLANFFILGPMKDKESYLIASGKIPESYHLRQILPPSLLDISFFISILLSVSVFVFIYKTLPGYELRMFGTNRKFAGYGGISSAKYFILPMVLSGAFHGLAGSFSLMGGRNHAAVSGFTFGMGWNGIAVALIGRNHPLLVIPAALIFSFLESGSQAAVINTDFSFRLDAVIRGIIFLFITASLNWNRNKR